jgi:hypothetical protein
MHPDPLALSALLKPLVTRELLRTIAEADYGMDFAEHLAALEQLHEAGKPSSPLNWYPKEALELMRWSEPENPEWKPGCPGTTGHVIREFCSGALMQASADSANDGYVEGENQTAAQLVDSALHLGNDHVECARRLLAWWILRENGCAHEAAIVLVGILILTAALALPGESPLASTLIGGAVSLEAQGRLDWNGHYPQRENANWLWGLTFFNMRHDRWKLLVATHLSNPPTTWPLDVRDRIQQFAAVLLGNAPPESIGSTSPVFE